MKLFPTSKPPPTPAEPEKDRLTVSPFKLEATGSAVRHAVALTYILYALWFVSLVVYAIKPFPIPSPVAEVSKLVPKGG